MSCGNRRRFVACLSGLALATSADPVLCSFDPGKRAAWAGESRWATCVARGTAFGTTVEITVRHSSEERGRRAAEAGLAELARVESLLTLYRDDSPVSRLNRQGWLDDPPPELVDVLTAAARMSRLSDGAFDVTVQPLWEGHDQARREGRTLSQEEVAAARRAVDWRRVRVTSQRIEFASPRTRITLNGIAQGYVTDKVREVLAAHGASHALIDAGEIGALGKSAESRPWRVGIQHPRIADAYIAVASLDGRCLATSGDYATTFSDDFRRHHVFDPRSGMSPGELASVSVVARSSMEADALSTALLVLGCERGERLVRAVTGAAALFVTKSGRVRATDGFPRV